MKTTLFVAFVMCSLPLTINAQQGTCGTGVTWKLNDSTLHINGDGEMDDFDKPSVSNAKLPSWEPYRSQIKNVVVSGNVYRVGNYSFYQYTDLTSVNLNEGVKQIGSNAFNGCTSLSTLSLPESLEEIGWSNFDGDRGSSFANCIELKEITLPTSLKIIGKGSFSGCNIEKINWNAIDCDVEISAYSSTRSVFYGCPVSEVCFGSEVKSVPEKAFINLKGLYDISTNGTIEYVGENAFKGTAWIDLQEKGEMLYIDHAAYIYIDGEDTSPLSLEIAEGTTGITGGALENNKRLVKIILPKTLKRIGEDAFAGCSSLREVEYNPINVEDNDKAIFPTSVWNIIFGEEVKNIPAYLLYQCSGIGSITLPESLEAIGDNAFYGCGGVKELIIPDKVEKIGKAAICDMANIEELTIGEGLKELDYGSLFAKCPNLKHITWNAIALNEKTFSINPKSCMAPVETVVFGDKVEYVPGVLFYSCATLTNVSLGKSVKKIGEAAFRSCTNLKEIDLPESLETVCYSAFYKTGIETLFIPRNVEMLDNWAFATSTLKSVILAPLSAPQISSTFDKGNDILLYVPNMDEYYDNWTSYRKSLHPMVYPDKDSFIYDGTSPEVSFFCNIPEYELAYISDITLNSNAGEHSQHFTASFTGKRDFTVELVYDYTVNKGIQQIFWEQSFDGLKVGDEIILEASASSGLEVTYLSIDGDIELITTSGKTIMICNGQGEVELTAQQQGDDNWESASPVIKTFTIEEGNAAINQTETDRMNHIQGLYDITGRKLNSIQKGINIIHNSDGSVHKIIVR